MQHVDAAQAVEELIAAVGEGAHALLVEGEPGIGKTTIAEAAAVAARQRGMARTWLHVGRPDTAVSFAALGDLLEAVPDQVLEDLPAPLRDALMITMLRAPGEEVRQDARAVSLAVLEVVRRLSSQQPLLLIIDDVQWLDVSSARILSFVLQRLDREPVAVLVARRSGEPGLGSLDVERDLGSNRADRLTLGPMSPRRFACLLRERVAPDPPRSVVLQIHSAVEGNPFFGQQLAREIVRQGLPGPGAPLPLPADAVVRQRLTALHPATREVLMTCALTSRPSLEFLARALPETDVEAALSEAEREELVVVRHGRVSFQHAIFASAVMAGISAPDRRSAHRRLAAASDSPEERARHLALSSLRQDADVADALEMAQVAARRRGAATAAAELAELSHAFTPDEEPTARLRRAVASGMLAFEAGDAARGLQALRRLVRETPPGPQRAAAMVTLCEICWQDTVEVERLAAGALDEPGADAVTLTEAHTMLAWVWVYRGQLRRAQHHVDAAESTIRPLDAAAARSDVLTIGALTAFLTGRPHEQLIAEAVALEDLVAGNRSVEETTIYSGARVTRGLIGLLGGDLEGAREDLEAQLERLTALGRYVARDEILCYLAHVACRTGAWADAERFAEECLEIDSEAGHRLGWGQNVLPHAWLAAVRGDLVTARAVAAESLELSTRYGDELAAAVAAGVLGLVALSAGDLPGAVAPLRRVVRFVGESGGCWPWLLSSVADAVVVLAAAGLLDEAEAVLEKTVRSDACPALARGSALAARGAAAVAAGRGRLDEAAEVLDRALRDATLGAQPFEHARTRLAAGEVERRRRSTSRARAHLEQAVVAFGDLGAPAWAERARSELARVNRGKDGGVLTGTELALVRLVVEGRTNREVAAALFVSVKTVEANLSHIYRRIGLRSRQELARWWVTTHEHLI